MKLLITGGHVSPALAVVDSVLSDQKHNHIEIVFVGREFVNEKEKNVSMEAQEIKKRKIPFIHIEAARIGPIFSRNIFLNIHRTLRGFAHAFQILGEAKPDVILTFGSYIGLPIAVAGKLRGVPVYVHEQTIRPGLATQFMGQFATEVFLAFADARAYFQQERTVITGNPLRKQIFGVMKKPFQLKENIPVIYITGGSLGSHSINALFEPILATLLEKYIIIHQTGNVEEFGDYNRLMKYRKSLPKKLASRYFIREHILSDEIGYVYSIADLVVSRSGANTFFELIALKIPAVLIPLPWSANGEQQRHAELFQDSGAGILFDQDDSSQNLLASIEQIMANLKQYEDNFKHLEELYHHDAIDIILKSYSQDDQDE